MYSLDVGVGNCVNARHLSGFASIPHSVRWKSRNLPGWTRNVHFFRIQSQFVFSGLFEHSFEMGCMILSA